MELARSSALALQLPPTHNAIRRYKRTTMALFTTTSSFTLTILLVIFIVFPIPSVSGFQRHIPFSKTISNTAMRMAQQDLQPPPLTDAKQLSLSWKQVAQRAATGVKAAFGDGHRRVSVDIPQISSVDRSTTARKFEDDNNFLLNLLSLLGAPKNPNRVGKYIEILDGGFEKGGDYLSDEGLYGYEFEARGVGRVVAIGNSEIDASALKALSNMDDGTSRILLFNCNPDRLSFFDKLMGLPNLDDVETAYLLRRIGPGFTSRQYPQDYTVWKLVGGKPILAASQPNKFEGSQANTALQ